MTGDDAAARGRPPGDGGSGRSPGQGWFAVVACLLVVGVAVGAGGVATGRTTAAVPTPVPGEPRPGAPAGGMAAGAGTGDATDNHTRIGETGTLAVDQPNASTWHTVEFSAPLADPVVVASVVTNNDTAPVHVRVRNVTNDSFEFRLEEWSNGDGTHGTETVHYLAVERGVHELENGTQVVAGVTRARATYTNVSYYQFDARPVVLSEVQTVNDSTAVVTRQRSVTRNDYRVRLQEDESNAGSGHATETVGFVAVAPGANVTNGSAFGANRTPNTVTDAWYTVAFEGSYADPPVLVSGMQTTDGGDTADLRHRNRTNGSVEVHVEEGTAGDSETGHADEVVGWFTFEGPGAVYANASADFDPSAAFAFSPRVPLVGRNVTFDATNATDADGTVQSYGWDFDGDGTFEVTTGSPTVDHEYATPGDRNVTLRVTDDDGDTATLTRTVPVRRAVRIRRPADGSVWTRRTLSLFAELNGSAVTNCEYGLNDRANVTIACDPLTNPAFENNSLEGWETGDWQGTTTDAIGGDYAARIGTGGQANSKSYIRQNFSAPENRSLVYWRRVSASGSCSLSSMWIDLEHPNGSTIATLESWGSSPDSEPWKRKRVDLDAYTNATDLRIGFYWQSGNCGYPVRLLVDDVTVEPLGAREGNNTLTVYAETDDGTVYEETSTFRVDTQAPNVTVHSPEPVDYNETDRPLNVSVDEPLEWITYSLNGRRNASGLWTGFVNGGFETGSAAGWAVNRSNGVSMDHGEHSGRWALRVGGTNDGVTRVRQNFTVTETNHTLTYWLRIRDRVNTNFDSVYLYLNYPNGTHVTTLEEWPYYTGGKPWTKKTWNLSKNVSIDGSRRLQLELYQPDASTGAIPVLDDVSVDNPYRRNTTIRASQGNNSIRVCARDAAGNVGCTTRNFTVNGTNDRPRATFSYAPLDPIVGESMRFDASNSSDTDGTVESYEWDFDDDGIYEATGAVVNHSFGSAGVRNVTLRVTDNGSATDTARADFEVLPRPSLRIETPVEDRVYDRSRIKLTWTIDEQPWELDACTYSLNGGPNRTTSCDPIENGGFERGNLSAWATGYPQGVTSNALQGDYAARLGESGQANSHGYVQTNFTASANRTLTYWRRIEGTSDSCADSGMWVYLRRPDGTKIATLESWGTTPSSEPWTRKEVNLSAYTSAERLRIHFAWKTGNCGWGARMFVDEVYVERVNATNGTNVLTVYAHDDRVNNTYTSDSVFAVNASGNAHPVAEVGYAPDPPVVGRTTTFDGSGSVDPDGNVTGYEWDFGDGSANATGETVDHTYAANDTYTVTLTVTDDDGTTHTTTRNVTVNRAPNATFEYAPSGPRTLDPVSFDATNSTDPDGSVASYEWDFGDGSANATGATTEHAYADDGTYAVTLTVTDDDGTVTRTNRTVTVSNRAPNATFEYAPTGPRTLENVTFDATDASDPDGSVASYEWDFGDGSANATGATVDHAFADDGTYTVTLTVTDDDGATDRTTRTVTVSNRAPNATFEYAPSDPVSGENVTFDAANATDPDGSVASYEWDFGDGSANATGATVDHSYVDNGTYAVTLTVTDDDGAADRTTRNVTVNAPPNATFEYAPTEPLVGENVTFDATNATDPDGSVASYEWDFGDGSANDSGGTVEHSFGTDGTYTVTLTVTDDDGATARATANVTVVRALLDQRWAFDTGGRTQYARPAVGPDRVVVGGLDSTLSALYRANGSVAWQLERDGSLSDSSPVRANGRVYVGSGGGTVYAVNATTGSVAWTHTTDSAVVSTPAVGGGTVYVGSNDGTVLALSEDGGSVEWRYDAGAPVLSTVAFADGGVYVTTDDGRVIAIGSTFGTAAWSYDTGTALGHSSPVVSNGSVYVAADLLYALDADTGSLRWTAPYGGTAGATPAVVDGTVYAGAANGSVAAYSTADGSVQWRTDLGVTVASDPAAVGDRVVVGANDGRVYLLDAATGSVLANASLATRVRAAPAVADGVVFVGSHDGTVVALENLHELNGSSTAGLAEAPRGLARAIGSGPDGVVPD